MAVISNTEYGKYVSITHDELQDLLSEELAGQEHKRQPWWTHIEDPSTRAFIYLRVFDADN